MANGTGKFVGQYPELLGRRFAWAMDWTGPDPYDSANKDVVTLPGFQYYLDSISGMMLTESGNYYVVPQCKSTGNRATFVLVWFTAGGTTEVANGVDLSGEVVRLSGLGGTY